MTRKILVMRLAPRQRIAPTNSVLMFFQVGRVKRGANAAKTDIISDVIAGQVLVPYCFQRTARYSFSQL